MSDRIQEAIELLTRHETCSSSIRDVSDSDLLTLKCNIDREITAREQRKKLMINSIQDMLERTYCETETFYYVEMSAREIMKCEKIREYVSEEGLRNILSEIKKSNNFRYKDKIYMIQKRTEMASAYGIRPYERTIFEVHKLSDVVSV